MDNAPIMKTTIRRSGNKVHTAQASPKRSKAPTAVKSEQAARQPILQAKVDAARHTPQLEADALRDRRLVKDLRDNANRSDLTKHRREISATKEDNEDADEAEDEMMLQPDQDTEPATASDVSDTSEIADP